MELAGSANKKRVRVGVIGAGAWAVANHIPLLMMRDDVELVVAVRKGKESLSSLQSQFGFRYTTEDYEEALAMGLDAVVVSSPAALHFEHASAALRAGCNVLCEKPFTIAPSDAWALHELAETKGRHLLVAFGWNYGSIGSSAKTVLAKPGVGPITQVVVHMASGSRELLMGQESNDYYGGPTAVRPEKVTWADPNLSGGGYAAGQLSHAFGMALWLIDDPLHEVFAFTYDQREGVDLFDAIAVRFTSGGVGTVSGASLPRVRQPLGQARHQMQMRFYGDEGFMTADWERDLLILQRYDGTRIELGSSELDGRYSCSGPVHALVDLTMGRSADNNSPGALGARTVEAIAAAYESARLGKAILI